MRISMNQRNLKRPGSRPTSRGFTLVELIIATAAMTFVVLTALALYSRNNQVIVEQSQMTQVQQDVRSGMFLISRDIRMAGVGLPQEYQAFYLQGVNNEVQDASGVMPDRLLLMGNLDDPLNLKIEKYQGSATVSFLLGDTIKQNPYPNSYYVDKIVLIIPNPASPCFVSEKGAVIRKITDIHNNGTKDEVQWNPGLGGKTINPPGGLNGCSDSDDYDGGLITFIDVKEYWLDVTGNYTGLAAGVDGYIGNGHGGILYMTLNGEHYPLAQDVENLQFEYNGDFNADQNLDGFAPWDTNWTVTQITSIRQIRIQILGRTEREFRTVTGMPSGGIQLYRRPDVSDNNGAAADDKNDLRKRFLIESVSNIRNMSLNLYNSGIR